MAIPIAIGIKILAMRADVSRMVLFQQWTDGLLFTAITNNNNGGFRVRKNPVAEKVIHHRKLYKHHSYGDESDLIYQ